MSLPISPGEKKAVLTELLAGGEGDTEEEAAADLRDRVIHALVDARADRKQYLVASNPGHMWGLWGPFPTTASAHRGFKKVPVTHEGQRFLILPLHKEAE